LAQTEFFHTRLDFFQNHILLVNDNSLDVQNILFKKTDFTKSGSKNIYKFINNNNRGTSPVLQTYRRGLSRSHACSLNVHGHSRNVHARSLNVHARYV
jgi:hypothetical protein